MRLFFAFELPSGQPQALARLLPEKTAGVRPVRADRMHVTIRFVGTVSPDVRDALVTGLPGISHVIARVRPEVRVVGTGVFPGLRRPRVLWAGIRFDPGLRTVHEAIASLCRETGLPDEEGPWRPHVTLARLSSDPPAWLPSFLDRNTDLRLRPFVVRRVILFDSRTESTGPVYTPLATAGD